ncbi:MAG: STAS/SEC14 domain-containing protein [Actinomycetota bacterium]
MLESIADAPDGVIAMRAVGEFTIDDYLDVVEPQVHELDGGHADLRLVLELGSEFTGFGDGAWGDLTDEIRHTHFHRGAVVTDDRFIRTGIDVLKWTLHGHVRTFGTDELEHALRWVAHR